MHFEIPADQPERAAKFYRELFGWNINRWENPGGMEYWLVETVPTDAEGRPVRQGVNGGLMPRMFPGPVPGMGWVAQLADTEENVFAVWQTDMNAGTAGAVGEQTDQAGR